MNGKRSHGRMIGVTAMLAFGFSLASTGWTKAAGNVQLGLQDGSLIITGDEADNNIIVIRECCDKVIVTGRAETTVNGSAGRVDVEGVTNDVAIKMRGGDDFVRVEMVGGSAGFPRNLKLNMGKGDDVIELLGIAVNADTNIDTGDGNDIILIDGVLNPNEYVRPDFRGNFNLEMGSGNDLFEFHHALFRGVVDARMGTGIDGVCNTEDSEFRKPEQARFDGGPPSGFPGDGFVAPIVSFTQIVNFEDFPDDCAYLGGRD